jgi:hypothetical protein
MQKKIAAAATGSNTVAAGKAKWKSWLAFARPSPLYPAQKVG